MQSRTDLRGIEDFFALLHPANDEQHQLLATAKQLATSIVQTNLIMSRQLANPLPSLLLVVIVCWSSLLFLGFGLLANFNAVTVAAEALGAMAVASAIFLILEFSHPYSGVFSISVSGIDQVLGALIEEPATRRVVRRPGLPGGSARDGEADADHRRRLDDRVRRLPGALRRGGRLQGIRVDRRLRRRQRGLGPGDNGAAGAGACRC